MLLFGGIARIWRTSDPRQQNVTKNDEHNDDHVDDDADDDNDGDDEDVDDHDADADDHDDDEIISKVIYLFLFTLAVGRPTEPPPSNVKC